MHARAGYRTLGTVKTGKMETCVAQWGSLGRTCNGPYRAMLSAPVAVTDQLGEPSPPGMACLVFTACEGLTRVPSKFGC